MSAWVPGRTEQCAQDREDGKWGRRTVESNGLGFRLRCQGNIQVEMARK